MLSWTRAERPETAFRRTGVPATSTSLDGNEDSPAVPAPCRSARRPARRVRRGRQLRPHALGLDRQGRLHDDLAGELQLPDGRGLRALQGAEAAGAEGR